MHGRGVRDDFVHESGALTDRTDRDSGVARRAREMAATAEPRRGAGGPMPVLTAGAKAGNCARVSEIRQISGPSQGPVGASALGGISGRRAVPSVVASAISAVGGRRTAR